MHALTKLSGDSSLLCRLGPQGNAYIFAYSLTDPVEAQRERSGVRLSDTKTPSRTGTVPVLTCFRLIVQHRLRLLQGPQDRRRFRDFVSGLSTDPGLHPKARRVADEAVHVLSS